MGTDVLIGEAFPGDPASGNSKKIWARKRGRGGRGGPRPLAVLDQQWESALEDFLSEAPLEKLPMLMRWTEFRDHYHRGSELDALIVEVGQALAWAEVGSDTAELLGRLLALVRRAREEHLVLAVIVD